MLHRSHAELYEHLRDYMVVRENGEVAGCVALHVLWKDLAELKGLAVDERFQGRGYGKALARAVLDEARRLGIDVVYALTYRPTFFEEVGFRVVPMAMLPRKVWGECFRCPKFNDCHEVPVVYEVTPGAFSSVNRTASAPIQLVPLWERPKR
jgi:amino-acid N-acetyltransferase